MENKKIYLDQNVLSEYLAGESSELVNAILELKKKNSFLYSPAHMEELAVPFMAASNREIKQRVLEEIDSISELTGNREVFPGSDRPMHITIEHPSLCFKRVIDFYHLNSHLEQQESEQLEWYKSTDPTGKTAQKMSNESSSILLQEEHSLALNGRFHLDFLAAMSARQVGLRDFNYPEILKSHTAFERCIEITFCYLESIRYRPEAVKKSRSRMHDVSHAIYGSIADILVTDDDRFSKKVQAVYEYWGIQTEILSTDGFISKVVFWETA
ncbi:hypothetical protein ACVBOS_004295 [Vibrio vulnificus]|nr:hypothetical protein CRN41_10045 [Vibrio vulnificus]